LPFIFKADVAVETQPPPPPGAAPLMDETKRFVVDAFVAKRLVKLLTVAEAGG
jgi:hypothetical protein